MVRCAVGVSCDVVKAEEPGAKFYNFKVHFFDSQSTSKSLGSSRQTMSAQALFVKICTVSKTSNALQRQLTTKLTKSFFVQSL